MNALSFGEILFDIIQGEYHLGGAPLNFAAHLAKLGAHSYIFSRVGDDEPGSNALKQLSQLGVQTDFIGKDHRFPTGTVAVKLDEGQPDYNIAAPVAYDFIDFEEKKSALLNTDLDILYIGTLAQRNEKSGAALSSLIKQKGFNHIFYDVNLRGVFYSREIVHRSLGYCTILKLNNEEVKVVGQLIFGKDLNMEEFAVQVSRKYNIDVVVITTGAAGCLIYDRGKIAVVTGYPVQVVDTVGAGDAFSAAFVYHYLQEGDALKAGDIANRLGAYVASNRGPNPKYSEALKRALRR